MAETEAAAAAATVEMVAATATAAKLTRLRRIISLVLGLQQEDTLISFVWRLSFESAVQQSILILCMSLNNKRIIEHDDNNETRVLCFRCIT